MVGASTHASLRRDASPCSDRVTGEVRVPLSLYCVDNRLGDVELVLSRTDKERLLRRLGPLPRRRRRESVGRRPSGD